MCTPSRPTSDLLADAGYPGEAYDIATDRFGTIWIAGWGKAATYGGTAWTYYPNGSLPVSYLEAFIATGHTGSELWFGKAGGVARLWRYAADEAIYLPMAQRRAP